MSSPRTRKLSLRGAKSARRVCFFSAERIRAQLEAHDVLATMRKELLPKSGGRADHDRYRSLERLVIEACVDAKNYCSRTDPSRTSRDLDTDFLSALSRHREQVKQVGQFIHRHAGRLGPALKQMHRVGGIRVCFQARQPLGDAWSALLFAYAAALDTSRLPARQGPYAHRFREGPLDFAEPIDGRRGPHIKAAQTGLLFQLALYFRRFSLGVDGETLGYIQTGEPMPANGKPCWDLCGEILSALFGEPVPAADDLRRGLGKLLKRYPHLTFVGWPRGSEPKSKK